MKLKYWALPCLLAVVSSSALSAQTQRLTLPPTGANQRAVVTQYMGLVSATIDYNSPDVHSPTGEDRSGKIWGQLVPWGTVDLSFNDGKKSPWRAGANEISTFTVSHDVLIEGKKLPAGKYGLHMIPSEQDWIVIFSKNSQSWGSFSYEEADDALRVTVKAEKAEYVEWLSYDFSDRQLASSVAALRWERLRVPWRIEVPNSTELYVENLRDELTGGAGFDWRNWNAAVQFVLQQDAPQYLEQALAWSEKSLNAGFGVGERNFTTLMTKAQVLEKLGREAEAGPLRQEALDKPATTVIEIHQYGRQLLDSGKKAEALAIFQMNAKRHPNTWPVDIGLARGFSAAGDQKKALEHAKKALALAPDDGNRNNIKGLIAKLEKGEAIN